MSTNAIILQFLESCNKIIWGFPMLFLLLGTHLFFTIRLRFVQRHLFRGIRYSVQPESRDSSRFSGFASLSTILAATIGIGNIIGVSTAIALGGPGAIFWCLLTGVLGMATSYAESYLSLRYRKKNEDGTYSGGPMYVLEKGLHSIPLALLFALFTMTASLGVGCSVQSSSAAEAMQNTFQLPPMVTGFILSIPVGFVLLGGSKAVGKVCTYLVPAMGFFFLTGCFFLLYLNRNYLLPAISLIVRSAFLPQAAKGGFIGSTILLAARFGVARGLFTNEAGLGSAPIAAASAQTQDPIRQSLISMTAVFWDTVVLCAITGVAVVSHMLRFPELVKGLASTELTTSAFSVIPYLGSPMLALSIVAFSFATILGWYYFGERAFLYLCEKLFSHSKHQEFLTAKALDAYRIIYIVMVFFGAVLSMDLVWELTDLVNACMALPNLLALLSLYQQIKIKK